MRVKVFSGLCLRYFAETQVVSTAGICTTMGGVVAVLVLSVYANNMRLGTKSAIVEHLTTKTAIFWLNALPFSGPTPIWLGAQFTS